MSETTFPEWFPIILRHRWTHQIGAEYIRGMERIFLAIRIESERLDRTPVWDCIVDTGCPLPILFPRNVWQSMVPAIEQISHELEATLPDPLRRSQGAGGGHVLYRFWTLPFHLCDRKYKKTSRTRPRLVAFETSGKMGGEPLIGLGGGILTEYALYLSLFQQRAELRS